METEVKRKSARRSRSRSLLNLEISPLNIMEALDDSPMFRKQVEEAEEELSEFASKLRQTIKYTKQSITTSQAHRDSIVNLTMEMVNLPRTKNSFVNKKKIDSFDFDKEVQFMAHALQAVEDQRANSIRELENLLIKPLENLLESIKEIRELGKKWHRLCNTYDSLADKFSQIKKNSSRLDEADQELQDVKRQYFLLTLEYSVRVNALEAKRRLIILKGFTDVTFSYDSGLSQSKEFMEAGYDRANDLKGTIDKEMSIFDQTETKLLLRIKDMVDDKLQNANKTPNVSGSRSVTSEKGIRGYLFQKAKKNVMREWKRKYFMISNGKLLCFKNSETQKPKEEIDLVVCTVKPTVDSSRNYCFEVISPYKTFFLQTDSNESLYMWMTSLQNEIAKELDKQQISSSRQKGPRSSADLSFDVDSLIKELCTIDPNNAFCVDCGDRDPVWISINLGLVMCLECSGIHRSLGTSISKVRSLTLDKIDVDTIRLLKALGNSCANSVFLQELPLAIKKSLGEKLSKNMTRPEREQWIKGKYLDKMFVAKCTDDVHGELVKSIQKRDLHGCYKLIMQGANINLKMTKDKNKAPLHYAAIAGDAMMIELLCQNGADVNITDDDGNAPIHYSAQKSAKCTAILCKKGAKLDTKNNNLLTPIELALQHENAHCVTLLRLGQQANEERLLNEDSTFIDALNSFSLEIEDSEDNNSNKTERRISEKDLKGDRPTTVRPLRKESNIFLASDKKL